MKEIAQNGKCKNRTVMLTTVKAEITSNANQRGHNYALYANTKSLTVNSV